MNDTFLFRMLNPIRTKKSLFFMQIFGIWRLNQSQNLAFVVTKWYHNASVPQQAASEMGVGLPQPAYRSRLQTAVSGFG